MPRSCATVPARSGETFMSSSLLPQSADPSLAPDGTKRVVVAEELGYCWGVRRAVDIISASAVADGPVAPVGDIIHNPQVVQRLRLIGVDGAESVEQAKERGFN